jgi:hypothetical protein
MAELQSGESIVMPYPELAESEALEERLGRIDLAQLLGGDVIAVLKSRRQTRERGLVPGRQPQRLRRAGSLPLQLNLDQRRPHPQARAASIRAGDRRDRPCWRRR